jgi:hypothetical protein
MLDGVYVGGEEGDESVPRFVPAPRLTDTDVQRIVETTARRVVRLCQRRGLLEEGAVDPYWEQEPLLAQLAAASVQGVVATGERAGRRVRRQLSDPEDGVRTGALCYAARGFSLHAATRVEASDRRRLERLCRYVIRPPVAARRLRVVDDETLVFQLKTPWADGTASLVLSPTELIEKLAALVPPPRTNLIRYHGVLAPAATDRDRIVPGPSPLTAVEDAVTAGGDATGDTPRRHRVEWAKLLARVFQVDVTCCPACGGSMKIIAALTSPASIRKVLDALGLPSRAPPVAPARFQQLELEAA